MKQFFSFFALITFYLCQVKAEEQTVLFNQVYTQTVHCGESKKKKNIKEEIPLDSNNYISFSPIVQENGGYYLIYKDSFTVPGLTGEPHIYPAIHQGFNEESHRIQIILDKKSRRISNFNTLCEPTSSDLCKHKKPE